jgi:hypothetical protein
MYAFDSDSIYLYQPQHVNRPVAINAKVAEKAVELDFGFPSNDLEPDPFRKLSSGLNRLFTTHQNRQKGTYSASIPNLPTP